MKVRNLGKKILGRGYQQTAQSLGFNLNKDEE